MESFLKFFDFMKMKIEAHKTLSCSILGAVFSFGLPPYHHWVVSMIILSIFFRLFINRSEPRAAFIAVFVFSLSNFYLSSYWIINTFLVVINNESLRYLTGLVTLLTVSAFMASITALCVALGAFLASKIIKINLFIILIPMCWAASEYIRSVLLGGQPMHYVGYMFGENDYLIQIGSLLNVYMVSFFFVFISALMSLGLKFVNLGALVLLSGFLFGLYRVDYMKADTDNVVEILRVRLVSANLTQDQLLQAQNTFDVADKYIKLSKRKGAFVPDLIIWPESVLQFYVDSKKNIDHITKFLQEGQVLIAGGPRYEYGDDGEVQYYASMFQFNDKRQLVGVYDKHILVPWGEFIPYREAIPKAIADIFDTKDYTPGSGPLLLNYKDTLGILPLLCAEGHYPQLLAKHQNNQDLILMIGNEAWLEGTTEPSQYFVNARYRAVESGLPVLLVSNKGYSAVISNKGIVLQSQYQNKPSVLDAVVKVRVN